MKQIRIILFTLSLFLLASCGSSLGDKDQEMLENTLNTMIDKNDNYDQSKNSDDKNIHKNYIFSLYKTSAKNTFQIYRNNEKFASFNLKDEIQPLAMHTYSGDCYILISNINNDSIKESAQIYKNGKTAMLFLPEFDAKDFDIYKAHFFAIGSFADTTISIYKDGLRIYDFEKKGRTPEHLTVYDDNIYYTLYKNNETTVYKEQKKLFSIPGHCTQFEVSALGVYILSNNKIYHDGKIYMEGGNSYTFFGNDLTAQAVCISASARNFYTGIMGELSPEKHYASVFQQREHFITIKPDDKPLGESKYQTRCCAVSACENGVYYITQKTLPAKEYTENIYHYYFNSEEVFQIEPSASNAELVYVNGI